MLYEVITPLPQRKRHPEGGAARRRPQIPIPLLLHTDQVVPGVRTGQQQIVVGKKPLLTGTDHGEEIADPDRTPVRRFGEKEADLARSGPGRRGYHRGTAPGEKQHGAGGNRRGMDSYNFV